MAFSVRIFEETIKEELVNQLVGNVKTVAKSGLKMIMGI